MVMPDQCGALFPGCGGSSPPGAACPGGLGHREVHGQRLCGQEHGLLTQGCWPLRILERD